MKLFFSNFKQVKLILSVVGANNFDDNGTSKNAVNGEDLDLSMFEGFSQGDNIKEIVFRYSAFKQFDF